MANGESQKNWREILMSVLIYPGILAVLGFGFNWYLDKTKKIEIGEKVVERLFADKPQDSFAADQLLGSLFDDKELVSKLHGEMVAMWKGRLRAAINSGNVDLARQISDAANDGGEDLGHDVLLATGQSKDVKAFQQQQQPLTESQSASGKPGSQSGVKQEQPSIDPASIKDDKQLSPNDKAILAVLPDIKAAESKATQAGGQQGAWIYLGVTSSSGGWSTSTYQEASSTTDPLSLKGKTVTLKTDTYKRISAPSYSANGGWKLGDIEGVAKERQQVTVYDVKNVPGTLDRTLWWAYIAQP